MVPKVISNNNISTTINNSKKPNGGRVTDFNSFINNLGEMEMLKMEILSYFQITTIPLNVPKHWTG